jgi:hypothetical protein
MIVCLQREIYRALAYLVVKKQNYDDVESAVMCASSRWRSGVLYCSSSFLKNSWRYHRNSEDDCIALGAESEEY